MISAREPSPITESESEMPWEKLNRCYHLLHADHTCTLTPAYSDAMSRRHFNLNQKSRISHIYKICTYKHKNTYVFVSVCLHMNIYISIQMHIFIIYTHMYACVSVYTYSYVYIYTCMYIYVRACKYIYIFISEFNHV